MRLLIFALTLPALAQPALAREHSRHHARAAAHVHHANAHAVRHHRHARAHVRRHREPGLAFAGQRYGAFIDRQLEYSTYESYADRPFAHRYERPFVPSFAQGREPFAPRFERRAAVAAREGSHGALDAMISRHAQANGLPDSLVHRVVVRESRYNPRAIGRGGAMGLMQIKYSTARAMGYSGSPSRLLDPETNLTYAVRYLAGAYRAAGGNAGGAVSNYARGYYASARRAGFSPYDGARGDAYASAQPVERVAWTGSRRRAARWN